MRERGLAVATKGLITGLMPDEEVIERVRLGEVALFEIILRRYNQRLYRVAKGIVGDDSEAEDVVQEAYVRAYTHLGQFANRAKFSTWLTKIAVHEALSRVRRGKKFDRIDSGQESTEGSMTIFASTDRDPEQQTSDHELKVILESAVESLPENYRSVFMMREMEGMSTAETAECLDLSEENVKGRLHRARAMLREKLDARVGAAIVQGFQFAGSRCDRITAAVLARIMP